MTYTDQILNFLSQINIQTEETSITESTFVPGILIDKGVLKYDPEKLKYPGDLLHEAGHIAIMSPEERPTIVGDVGKYRTPAQDDEMGVIGWTYAALKHLEIPIEVVFHENGYKGESYMIINNLEGGMYIGLPLLVWMDLCDFETFPKMKKWVRE